LSQQLGSQPIEHVLVPCARSKFVSFFRYCGFLFFEKHFEITYQSTTDLTEGINSVANNIKAIARDYSEDEGVDRAPFFSIHLEMINIYHAKRPYAIESYRHVFY
jgi:hypothetical protein